MLSAAYRDGSFRAFPRQEPFKGRILVRMGRLELPHLAAPDPESGASTDFATSANSSVFFQGNRNPTHDAISWRRGQGSNRRSYVRTRAEVTLE